jgi:hypothetical protein
MYTYPRSFGVSVSPAGGADGVGMGDGNVDGVVVGGVRLGRVVGTVGSVGLMAVGTAIGVPLVDVVHPIATFATTAQPTASITLAAMNLRTKSPLRLSAIRLRNK